MSKKKLLFTIILLGFFLRFYNLSHNPPSLDWDEAAIGYNAYSILKTAKDEYGQWLPLSFQSFGDYKPPLYIYLAVIPIGFFGLNEFAVRSISALFGAFTVAIVYYLVKELFDRRVNEFQEKLALTSSLFMAASPWHLQFSRAAFEANLALFFSVFGILLFLKGMKRSRFLPFSAIILAASMYSYHSSRLFIPLLLLGLFYYFRSQLLHYKVSLIFSATIAAIMLFPLVFDIFGGQHLTARFGAVSGLKNEGVIADNQIFRSEDMIRGDFMGSLVHIRLFSYMTTFLASYGDHFDLRYLFFSGDMYLRHNANRFGLLYYWEMFVIPVGAVYLLRTKEKKSVIIFWWFLVAPVASALTKGTPHAIRSLTYLPIYQIFSALGILSLTSQVRRIEKLVVVFVLLFFVATFFYYLDIYHLHTPFEQSQAWQYGYKEAMGWAKEKENQVEKIVFTNRYDQPYIYYLFYRQIDPSWYQQVWHNQPPSQNLRKIGKYEFRKVFWDDDDDLRNVAIIGSAGEPPEIPSKDINIAKEIFFLDGTVAFRIVQR